MEITNKEKAREICGCGNCHHNFKGNECLKYTGILCCLKPCFKDTLQAMEWKDEQFVQEKQQLIDKAWDWLTNQKGEHTKEDFIKAIKGE